MIYRENIVLPSSAPLFRHGPMQITRLGEGKWEQPEEDLLTTESKSTCYQTKKIIPD